VQILSELFFLDTNNCEQ